MTANLTKDSNGTTHSTAPFFPIRHRSPWARNGGNNRSRLSAHHVGNGLVELYLEHSGNCVRHRDLDNQTLSTPITIQAAPTVTGVSPTSGPAAGARTLARPPSRRTSLSRIRTPLPPRRHFGDNHGYWFHRGHSGQLRHNSCEIICRGQRHDDQRGQPAGHRRVNVIVVTPNGSSPTSATAQFTFAVAAPTVVTLVRFGFHAQQTSLVLTFSAALNPTPAQDVNNYQIATADGTVIPVTTLSMTRQH